MRFKELYAEYMYSYEKLTVTEDQFNCGGLTAIIGRNLDQDTANGSGKSNILKAIYYLLYGTELNGVSIEEISNRVYGRGHFGEVTFEDKGRVFKIQRFRDYKIGKDSRLNVPAGTKAKQTGVRFFIDGVPFGDKKENGEERSTPEVNKIILNRIGVSAELFLASVMTAQDSRSNFLMATDTRKKELISELLDLQVYEEAYDNVKKDIDAKEKLVLAAKQRMDGIEADIVERQREIDALTIKDSSFQTEVDREFAEIEKRFNAAGVEYKRVKSEKVEIQDPKPIEDELALKKEELQTLNSVQVATDSEELKILQTQITETEGIIRLVDGDVSRLNGQIQSTENSRKRARTFQVVELELNAALKEKETLTRQNAVVFSLTDVQALNDLLRGYREKSMTLERKKAKIEAYVSGLKEKIKELESAEDCPTCNRPWDEAHKAERDEKIAKLRTEEATAETELEKTELELQDDPSVQAQLQIKILTLETEFTTAREAALEIETLKSQRDDLSARSEKLKKVLSGLTAQRELELGKIRETQKESQSKVSAVNSEIHELTQKLSEARVSAQAQKRWEDAVAVAHRRLQDIAEQAKQVKSRVSPYKELIGNAETRIQELNERLTTNVETMEKLQEELKYLTFWKNGFGPTGIRSFISDEVIIHLNEIVRDYLNDLFDGAITVAFESESINQKGGVSNKISTKFFLNGKESPIDLLSGGERQRVVLAVDLALSDIAEHRAGTKINLRFMDEPFNGIDSNGQMKSIALFSKIANRKNGFFIITHDQSFQALCQSTIFVVKKDEVSRVVSREEFRRIS